MGTGRSGEWNYKDGKWTKRVKDYTEKKMNNTVRVSNQKYIDYMKGIGEGKINALIEFKAEIKKIWRFR